MTTVGDILTPAARASGLLSQGQVLRQEDINTVLSLFNFMVAEWRRQRWLIYQLRELSLTTTGALTYTVGPGGDFDTGESTPRPERLEAAFVRLTNVSAPSQVDYPLGIILAYEDYSLISLKQLGSFPNVVFLNTGFPLATLYVYPVPPSTGYELHLIIKQTLDSVTGVAQTLDLPAEYMSAMHWNLAKRIAATYRIPATPELLAQAKNSLSVLSEANVQLTTLKMPHGLISGGRYNIYSDQTDGY